MAGEYTAEEIAARYSDSAYRDAFFRIFCINSILSDCIIADNYKAPSSLFSCIELTDYGNEFYRALRHKNVGHAEALVFCLLEIYHLDAYIDVMRTDTSCIVKSLGQQIKDRTILLPFIHGRLLYDKYANMFLDQEHSYLGVKETFQLLRNTPQGVFQALNLVTGPYGILESQSERYVFPVRDANLRHCSDFNCNSVHSVELSTSMDASVNEQRKIAREVQRKESEHGSDWSLFFREITARRLPRYKDTAFDPIILLIGDALTDGELRKLFVWLSDNSAADIQGVVHEYGQRGPLLEIASRLNRAELMQLILVVNDSDIVRSIDTLVQRGQIQVPAGEVRRSVVNS